MPSASRILLSEGASLTSRETVTALGLAGHTVEIIASDAFCLSRFSRFVTKVHVAPASGDDPDAYLAAVLRIIRERSIDVLMPVQEQAYLFAAARPKLPDSLRVALAEFSAFEQVQNKAAFSTLLDRLKVPQPSTEIIANDADFRRDRPLPFFVKAAFGTASEAVWRVADISARDALLTRLAATNQFAGGIIIQIAVEGALERTQSVFDRGRLVACHSYQQIVEGPGGGDVIKRSIVSSDLREYVERIGAALHWHGALSFDSIRDLQSGEPKFIDANPRMVEPMNAWLSGVDLAGALLQVSKGETAPVQPPGREGVTTSLGLMALLDAARCRSRRRDIVSEAFALAARRGRYLGTREELVPVATDPWCVVPLAFVAARLLYKPQSAAAIPKQTVAAYSLPPAAIARIRAWRSASRN